MREDPAEQTQGTGPGWLAARAAAAGAPPWRARELQASVRACRTGWFGCFEEAAAGSLGGMQTCLHPKAPAESKRGGARPGGWHRGPTSPGRTRVPGTGPGEWARQAAPGSGPRPSHAAFPTTAGNPAGAPPGPAEPGLGGRSWVLRAPSCYPLPLASAPSPDSRPSAPLQDAQGI